MFLISLRSLSFHTEIQPPSTRARSSAPGVSTPLFHDKNTQHIGKSQSKRPHKMWERPLTAVKASKLAHLHQLPLPEPARLLRECRDPLRQLHLAPHLELASAHSYPRPLRLNISDVTYVNLSHNGRLKGRNGRRTGVPASAAAAAAHLLCTPLLPPQDHGHRLPAPLALLSRKLQQPPLAATHPLHPLQVVRRLVRQAAACVRLEIVQP
jgi:hypothetical protein